MTAPITAFVRSAAELATPGNGSEAGGARPSSGGEADFRLALSEALGESVTTRRSRSTARREPTGDERGVPARSERLARTPSAPPPTRAQPSEGDTRPAVNASKATDGTVPDDTHWATEPGGGDETLASTDESAPAAAFVEMAIGTGGVGLAVNVAGAAAAAGAAAPDVTTRAATSATRATDPSSIRRSTTALAPELRLRLERVIERMKSEFGYTVEVVETVRTQERQEELFAQGRTTAGPVVTWTRNSKHTEGKAADVVIDGSYENRAAYETLARVARDEGLKSLWPRDGGHIELPGAARAAVQLPRVPGLPLGEGEQRAAVAPVARDHSSGEVADVARVARVAPVAAVARVADVAPVASVASVAQVAAVASVASVATVARVSTVHAADDGSSSGTPTTRALRAAPGDGEGDRGPTSPAGVDARDDGSLARQLLTHDGSSLAGRGAGGGEAVGALARSDATERIARVLKMQEGAADRPLSSVLLRLDSPDGGEDRVRIDLRGGSVGASFDVSDPRAADNMRSHAHELRQALERHGLEGDAVNIRTTQRSTEPASLNAAALAAERDGVRIGSTAASDGGGSTAKDSRNQPGADEWRDGASQQRSRQQRRDGKENR